MRPPERGRIVRSKWFASLLLLLPIARVEVVQRVAPLGALIRGSHRLPARIKTTPACAMVVERVSQDDLSPAIAPANRRLKPSVFAFFDSKINNGKSA